MYCANCGNQLGKGATFCDRCGAAINQNVVQPAPKKSSCLSTFLIIAGCIAVLLVIMPLMANSGSSQAPDVFDAQASCEEFVTRRLRSPATAKFSPGSDNKREKLSDTVFQIAAYVDSENGFGANIRSNYVCRVEYIPADDEWQLLEIDIR